MSKEERYIILRDKSDYRKYVNGDLDSKSYSKEELNKIRNDFENKLPDSKFNISKKRWLYEIARQFDLNEQFKNYPDAGIARLEFVLEFGLWSWEILWFT